MDEFSADAFTAHQLRDNLTYPTPASGLPGLHKTLDYDFTDVVEDDEHSDDEEGCKDHYTPGDGIHYFPVARPATPPLSPVDTPDTFDPSVPLAPLDPPAAYATLEDPVANLGRLHRLPAELILQVLGHLPLRALCTFAQVNRRAALGVWSMRSFVTLRTHTPVLYRTLLATDFGTLVTANQTYRALRLRDCENCRRNFGGYLYLFAGVRRVCYRCFTQTLSLLPLSPSTGWGEGALSREVRERVPWVRVKRRGEKAQSYTDVWSAAFREVEALYGGTLSEQEMRRRAGEFLLKRARRTGDRRAGLEGERFAGVVRAPWVDVEGGRCVWGVHCRGCEKGELGGMCWEVEGWEGHVRREHEVEEVRAGRWVVGGRVFEGGRWMEVLE